MMYETDYQSGEYQVSSDTIWPESGYTFNENLSKCENGSVLTWDNENKKVLMQANTSDKCYVYFDKEPNTLASYIINNVYTGTDGDNGLYYHDGIGTYTNADQEAGDNLYRYSGGNDIVNNYICFGNNETSCPTENLYRIIGVFNNKAKIIKATKIDENEYEYSSGTESCNNINTVASLSLTNKDIIAASEPVSSGCNRWEQSDLNEILNTTFYNSLSNDWKEKIENHNWNITGINLWSYPFPHISLKELFNVEMTNATDFYTAKIGLMYASDYVYGKNPSHWLDPVASTSNYDNYAINENMNWLFQTENEWTITRDIFEYSYSYLINSLSYYIMNAAYEVTTVTSYSGGVASVGVHETGIIRPTFYLNSDVQYVSGTGTETDPYRIA